MYPNTLSRGYRSAAIASLVLAGVMTTAQAGKITSVPSASGAEGFGGWNMDNVTVTVPDGSFDENTGAYTIGPDGLYWSTVDDGAGTDMATVLGKDWPVGEPPGIKVIHDDALVKAPKPENCIVTTSYLDPDFLDTGSPVQVTCSSPFQSHKRFKIAMFPALVDGVGAESVDLVFNVEAEAGARNYQMFQKINNWTDSRLEGFTVQVGFGVGAGFQTATAAGVLTADLSISVPDAIGVDALWAADELATFSHGLFGPADKHFPTDGFFDDVRAGFQIDQYPVAPGMVDTLTATTTLAGLNGSNYADVPTGAGAAANQFGPWLPNIWLPRGFFFDDDNDPDTDDTLVAWYGYNPATAGYEWMYGANSAINPAFGTVSAQDLDDWSNSPVHYVDEIDDLVNIGLNYLITVGDVTTFPVAANNTFTIRITPTRDTSGVGAPGYVKNLPPGTAELKVTRAIDSGDDIEIRVTDTDLNTDTMVAEEVTVPVENEATSEEVMVMLTETGVDTSVFEGVLATYERNAAAVKAIAQDLGVGDGDTVTTTYVDQADEFGNKVTLTADTDVTGLIEDDANDGDGGGGGGGGCTVVTNATLDPTLPLLVVFALVMLGWRRYER